MSAAQTDNPEIHKLIEDLYLIRKEIIENQKKELEYRNTIIEILNYNKVNSIYCQEYVLTKKHNNKNIIKKKNIPIKLWEKYSETIDYDALYIKKLKSD